jgi:hypothetical protein
MAAILRLTFSFLTTRRIHASTHSALPARHGSCAWNGGCLDLAHARSGSAYVRLRSAPPVCRRPAPWDRRGRSGRLGGHRRRRRHRVLQWDGADEREGGHDRDPGRLLGDAHAPWHRCSQEGCSDRRRSDGGHDRAERNARIRRAVRSPRCSHCRRRAGLHRPSDAASGPWGLPLRFRSRGGGQRGCRAGSGARLTGIRSTRGSRGPRCERTG